jgi:hypothetical protein
MAIQYVQGILLLREKQSVTSTLNNHAEKMVEGSKILHGKLGLESINDPTEQLVRRGSEYYVIYV